VQALADAGRAAHGATLYCTLEPCSHTGRTGPCAPRVVLAGIRRAVIAIEDPNPLVQGRGLAHLRDHGVDVSVGVLGEAAERQNAPFLSVMRRRRPFVTMKVALSREGAVAGGGGARIQLTGAAANRRIHRDRAEVDALGVGVGTILADDPQLTARGAFRALPLTRVVFDRTFRMPIEARLLATSAAGPIIVFGIDSGDARARAAVLSSAGARTELIPEPAGAGFLEAALTRLAELGISSLIVEGGPRLHAAAWTAGLVDRVQLFHTPVAAGPGAMPWLAPGVFDPDSLEDVRKMRLGDDIMVEGHVHRAG
jgi:diaminohydroxyphosphoribosylaminopyrimidine deaminase/5-amino-6-(5-phosphoribosylamino)uracil reductase